MRTRDTQINSVYLVTRPTAHSTVDDLVSGGSPHDLMLQFRGGLDANEIVAMFTDLAEAQARARWEIDQTGRTR